MYILISECIYDTCLLDKIRNKMARCKFCEQNNVITEGEWQKTQWGNRLFVNGQQHKCQFYPGKQQQSAQGGNQFQGREQSNTYVPQGYVQAPQQISVPQPAPEPAVLTQIQTTVEALLILIRDIKKTQDEIGERVDYLYKLEKSDMG
jgi:hypothetical protein